tara:strand:- start:188 stop:595 length:408 start_codon:yes stop_codon:yes gene_type:complete
MKYITSNNININKILDNKTCFVGIFSENCIHCQNMKPEWNKLIKKLNKIKCSSYLIEINTNDFNKITNKNLNHFMSYNGIPSIIKMKNGKILKDYKGDRTEKSLFKFINPIQKTVRKSINKQIFKAKKTRKNKKK